MTAGSEQVYSPSELAREVRLHLEAGFPRVLVEAEISNLSRPPSGHLYFSLKDDRAQIRCALFRSAAGRLVVKPANGMKVLARGRISLYEPRGDFQLIVDSLQEAGEGELQRQFEELRKRLEREGLFDPDQKQALPPFPVRVGLVTSPGGAAVRDLLHVLARRWPLARVRVYPVPVQGMEAPAKISQAIEAANRHDWAELLIVARGGGSLEDLAAFNDETVARAIFASRIPVISAVGHETDIGISDFVADLRAPTPSAAAELATPDQTMLRERLSKFDRQLQPRIESRLQVELQKLDHLSHRLRQRHPAVPLLELSKRLAGFRATLERAQLRRLNVHATTLESLGRRLLAVDPRRQIAERAVRIDRCRVGLRRRIRSLLESRGQQLVDLARTLDAVSPLQTIARGYAVLLSESDGTVVSSIARVSSGDVILAQLKDGRLRCTVRGSSKAVLDSPKP